MLSYLQDLFHTLDFQSLQDALLRVIAVFLCLTVHESCHGLAALALGDPTAKSMHRLSMNPLRHIDWLGLLMMFVAGFGWAKPVPVNPRYFKKPKQGMALTALAGPVSNLILAFAALLLYDLLLPLFLNFGTSATWSLYLGNWVLSFLLEVSILSVGLGLFNLIPIPPLDGSKVLGALLPDRLYALQLRYERYGFVVLLLISFWNIGGLTISRGVYSVWFFLAQAADFIV